MSKFLECIITIGLLLSASQYCLATSDDLINIIPIVEKREVWINPGLVSYHFDRNQEFNSLNYGLGFEYKFSSVSSFTIGTYRNSYYATSNYIGMYWQPLVVGPASIGVVAGGFNGYSNTNQGGWFPALLPAISIEGDLLGLNIIVIPTIPNHVAGSLTFQMKFKVFE